MEGVMAFAFLVFGVWVFSMITPKKGGPRDLNNH